MCNSFKKDAKKVVKNINFFFWGTPTTQDFFGSLGVPEHEKIDEQALSVANLFCRPNQYLIFYAIFSLHFKPLPFSPETSYTSLKKKKEIKTRKKELSFHQKLQ